MNKFTVYFIAGMLFLWSEVQSQFILSGEFRPRTEFSRGYKTLATKTQKISVTTAQRTRLNAIYNTEGIQTKLVMQDVRYWGSQPQLIANEDYATSVHEAWAELQLISSFSFRAGRQELVYDDHRIFGNVGWAQQARSHDLVLFKLEQEIKLHLGIAHHENDNITNNIYNGPDAYKDMQFVWINHAWKNAGLSLLLLNNGVPVLISEQNEKTRYSQTYGGRINYTLNDIMIASNLYGQTGKHRSGQKISAMNILAEASVSNVLTAGFEYLSGNSYDKSGKIYAFEPHYGTNHKFNGFMDYFFVGNHINSVGLQDAYLKYNYTKNKTSLGADLHYFASAGKISPDANKYLGTELDLTFSFKLQPSATLSAGWSVMFAGESMELLKGGNHNTGQHWGYIMLTVLPVFIN
jgi:hypothetical protein